jgi:membrane dipeptidase
MLAMVDLLNTIVERGGGQVEQIFNVDQLEGCLNSNLFGAILHFEGACPVDQDLVLLRIGYKLGLRSLGLTWSRPNRFAQVVGSADTGEGLTEHGRRLIKKCNELGILIDISHLNDAGFWDVVELTSRPFVASHSNSRAISPHPRNLTDDQIRAVAKSGGLVRLNFSVHFLNPDMSGNTDVSLDLMVDHMQRGVDVAGIDHIALGSDFDGTTVPDAIHDAAGTGLLIERLRAQEFDENAISKLCRDNWLRVFRNVWR